MYPSMLKSASAVALALIAALALGGCNKKNSDTSTAPGSSSYPSSSSSPAMPPATTPSTTESAKTNSSGSSGSATGSASGSAPGAASAPDANSSSPAVMPPASATSGGRN